MRDAIGTSVTSGPYTSSGSPELDPLAQHELETEIRQLVGRLTEVTQDIARLGARKAEAERAYRVGRAKAHLQATGTVSDREAKALVAVEGAFAAHLAAVELHGAAVETSRAIRAQLDALRSLNANVRTVIDPHH